MAVICARLRLVVVVLLPIWILLDGPSALAQARWGRGMIVGGLGFGFGTWLLLVAQSLSDPVAVVASAIPVCATVVEWMAERHQLSLGFKAGLTLSVLGGLIAAGHAGHEGLGHWAIAALISVFLYAWASHRTVRDYPQLDVLP